MGGGVGGGFVVGCVWGGDIFDYGNKTFNTISTSSISRTVPMGNEWGALGSILK